MEDRKTNRPKDELKLTFLSLILPSSVTREDDDKPLKPWKEACLSFATRVIDMLCPRKGWHQSRKGEWGMEMRLILDLQCSGTRYLRKYCW